MTLDGLRRGRASLMGGLGALLARSWSGRGRLWAASRDQEAEIDLPGQEEFHQQGQRAKLKRQNPKEETLHKEISNSRSTAPGGCYVSRSLLSPCKTPRKTYVIRLNPFQGLYYCSRLSPHKAPTVSNIPQELGEVQINM